MAFYIVTSNQTDCCLTLNNLESKMLSTKTKINLNSEPSRGKGLMNVLKISMKVFLVKNPVINNIKLMYTKPRAYPAKDREGSCSLLLEAKKIYNKWLLNFAAKMLQPGLASPLVLNLGTPLYKDMSKETKTSYFFATVLFEC